jgi:acetoin utilization protein AcuB
VIQAKDLNQSHMAKEEKLDSAAVKDTVLRVPVDEYTSPSPISVETTDSVGRAKALMAEQGIRHLIVLDQERNVQSVISDRDVKLLQACHDDLQSLTLGEVPLNRPYIVAPETDLHEVVFEMSKRKIGSAIVRDKEDNYLGIFTSTDALNALLEILRGEF